MIPEGVDEVARDRQVRQSFGSQAVLFGFVFLAMAVLIATIAPQGKGGQVIAKPAPYPTPGAPAAEMVYKYLFSFRHDDIVTCAAFSRNGRWLATGSELGTVIVTDIESHKELVVIRNPDSLDNGVKTLRFSQDGQLLLVGGFGNRGGGGQIKIFRTRDYTVTMVLDMPGSELVDYLDVSPDNKWLIVADRKSARIWNLQDKRAASHLIPKDSALLFNGDRTLLVAGQWAYAIPNGGLDSLVTTGVGPVQIVFFDIIDDKVTRVLRTTIEEPVRRLVLAKAQKELFVLTAGGTVYRLDSKTGAVKQRIALTELYRKVSPQNLHVWFSTDFEVMEDYPLLVFSDRRNTFFVNYDSNNLLALDHGSQVGAKLSPSGKEFAILGGVKQASLTGVPDQHYWTVNVFSFKPF